MCDSSKTNHELLDENALLKQRIQELELSESMYRQSELYREIAHEILQILNLPLNLMESMQSILTELITRTGFNAVAIRLQDGDDFPYFAQEGFSDDFLLTENTLIERTKDGGIYRDKDGNVSLECTCGLVISGKTDPANQLFTPGGSFWTNDSFPLLDIPIDEDPRHNPRNQCMHHGYASIALVPIRNRDRVVGLIQLNDRRKGRFTKDTVELLEGVASLIGAALIHKMAEEALRESEEQFKAMFENASVGMAQADPQKGQWVRVNQKMCEITGYSSGEMLAMRIPEITHPEDRDLDWQAFQNVIRGNLPNYRLEKRYVRKDGSIIWVNVNMTVIRDLNGQPIRTMATIEDINERKRVEEALRESEEKYRLVVENAAEVILIAQDGLVKFVNPVVVRILGYSKEELTSKPFAELLHPDDIKEVLEAHIRTMRGEENQPVHQFRVIAADGAVRWVNSCAVVISWEGKPAILNFLTDITESKETEKLLRESEELFRSLVDNMLDMAIIMDFSGRILFVNNAAVKMFGLERPEDALMHNMIEFLHPDSFEAAVRDLERVQNGEDGFPGEYKIVTLDKKEKWVSSLGIHITFNEQPADLVSLTNITSRKRMEENLQQAKEMAELANRTKSDFLANMSHELRTPLNAIIGFSEVLKDQYFGPLNDKQVEYTLDILESGKHLLNLINDILDLSKVEAGKTDLELSPVFVGELIRSSLIMIKEKALKHGISIMIDIPEELSDFEMLVDERKVKQILFNLLSNSAKFTPDGGIIALSAKRAEEEEGDIIEVSVKDTGIGIASDHQEHIFESFFQVQSNVKNKTPGTGLGLALSRRFVELQGGKIWVESEGEGKGSHFHFTLPIRPIIPTETDGNVEKPDHAIPIELNRYPIDKHPTLLSHLERIISLSKRQKRMFSLCYIRIAGDDPQCKTAEIKEATGKNIRMYDLSVFVEGGIALLLQDADKETAGLICERILKDMTSKVETKEASFSIAGYPSDGETPEKLITEVQSSIR